MKEFSVIIDKDEDVFFIASVPALRRAHHCFFVFNASKPEITSNSSSSIPL